MRGDRLARQWRIIQLLLTRRSGMSAAELAAELNYSVRNIYRDLDTLQKAGFPLYTERDGRSSRWTFVDGFRHATSIPFTADELMALEAARATLKPVAGTVYADSLKKALAKIRANLPGEVCAYLERARDDFFVAEGPVHDYAGRSAEIGLLHQAVKDRRTVRFSYTAFSTGRRTSREVDPYGMFYHEGTLYLVAHCHKRSDLRNFAVDRIQAPALTEKTFNRPEGFDMQSYMSPAFGAFRGKPQKVLLRFTPETARYIRERLWHPTQVLTEEPDGGCLLELHVPVSDEIVRWVLSWTPGCAVLGPAQLSNRILAAFRKMVDSGEKVHNAPVLRRKVAAKSKSVKDGWQTD